MQIAGFKCKVCGCIITLSTEGKFCSHCGTVVHLDCEPRATCDGCEQPFQNYEHPKADPLSDALLPGALRPSTSGGPALAIFVGVVLVLLAIIIWWGIEYTNAHGK